MSDLTEFDNRFGSDGIDRAPVPQARRKPGRPRAVITAIVSGKVRHMRAIY